MAISPGQGAALGGLAAAGGSILSGVFNARQAAKNRNFQLYMASTAYQRSMIDMRKAGLNPILAYKQGGAATPSGATATTPDIGRAPASALGALRLKQELRNMRAGEYKDDSQRRLNNVLGIESFNRSTKTVAETQLLKSRLPGAAAQAELDNTAFGSYARKLNRIVRSVTGRDSTGGN